MINSPASTDSKERINRFGEAKVGSEEKKLVMRDVILAHRQDEPMLKVQIMVTSRHGELR